MHWRGAGGAADAPRDRRPDALRGIYPIVNHHLVIGSASPTTFGSGVRGDRTRCAIDAMPYYVAPEQMMKDRADYARKGTQWPGNVAVSARRHALAAENPSNTLRKISEIYDRIAFAGVGKYNEFDQLRVAGVRAADLKGDQYSRDDVDARGLANQYAQILGQVFTHEMKPMEVEILVAEVGYGSDDYQLFHILYDGTVMDERRFSVLGGDAEAIAGRLNESYTDELTLAQQSLRAQRHCRAPNGRSAQTTSRSPCCRGPTVDDASNG
jgi:proteasome alpha subunit